MEVKCTFEIITFSDGYTFGCVIRDQQILEKKELKFVKQYDDGKSNSDVHCVKFEDCTVTRIPKGLTKVFPNMKILWITNSKLEKITKNDLLEYKNLQRFSSMKNDIEFLPDDLFEGFKNLEWIDFWQNKLKIIEPNILDGLENLKYVDFSNNPNFDMSFSTYPENTSVATLEEVKCDLFEKYPNKYKILKNVKDLKLKLEAELDQEKLKNSELTDKLHTGFYNDIKIFTQEETTKDFRIQIDAQEFPVHKFLLAARSPTMAEILKNNPEVENLNLVDISVEIFEIILKFLYTDELPGDNGTNFLQLFATTAKLKIGELKKFAATKLLDMIDEENAIEVLKLSNKYEHEELRQKSFIKIKEMYPKCDFKDSYKTRFDLMIKIIEQFKKYEEAIRKLEEEF